MMRAHTNCISRNCRECYSRSSCVALGVNEAIESWPAITVRTTIAQLKDIHRDIWNYAIKHGAKPHTPYIHNCVACAYMSCVTYYLREHGTLVPSNSCVFCPIKWPTGTKCNQRDNLYNRWALGDPDYKKELAEQIRDVEWEEDGYFE